ncbi:MAG: PAS domain S-box protein, partial [Pseudomonadota bacterium]|nr:PAS domain S-box protein [Pseudomonadota bacterium]
EVDSKIGLGTRFSFTLPLSRKSTEASKTPTHDDGLLEEYSFTVTHPVFEPVDKSTTTLSVPQLRSESQEGLRYKILIVDDEPVNLYVLVNYLSLYDYSVIQATSGHEALTLLEQGLQADLVLLDVMMPQMTGYEVTQAIRKRWQADELPILLLTAKNQIADLVTGLEVGANDYLIKPISKNELLARIKTHLRLKSLKAETVRLATEGEQRLTQFLQALPIGILVLDTQGQPYWLNKKAQQLLTQGIPQHEVEAIAAHYHLYPAGQHSVYPDAQLPGIMALKGETLRVDDLEIRHPEQTIPIEAWGAPIFDDNNQIIYALMAFQDITERRQAEQQNLQANQELYALNQKLEEYSHTLEQKVTERTHELQTSEASLAEAQYMARLGHWIWERHSQSITRSEQDCRNLGLPPEHCAPSFEAFLACVHPEDRAAISVIINFSYQALQQHSYDSTEFEFRVCWPNGQIRTLLSRIVLEFDATGNVERIKGLSQDITERHQMECALQDNVQFLETMLQAIPSPVFFKDHQGRYQGCNKAFETFTGYSKEALLGRTVFDVWPPEYAQRYHEHDLILLRTPGVHAYEAQVRAGDGSEHFVIFTKASYTNAQGVVAGVVGVFTDITERKQTEAKLQQAKQTAEQTLQQLQATQQRLIEAAKMADLGQLVAGVAHEINTPIGIGLTAASRVESLTQELNQSFEQGQLKRADFAKYLQSITQGSELISKNLKRAAELIQSFKQVAVDQSGEQRRTFVLKDYLEEILISLRPRLKATQHQITIEADPKLSINSYPGAFSQIITNLVINSLIHGFGEQTNGHIMIGVTKTQLSTLPEAPSGLLIRYSDDGQGIAAETLSHIFEPFFTTNRQGGGSGLGLHIVYNLVTHQLKGSIHCESEWGHGSCFIIEIPIN